MIADQPSQIHLNACPNCNHKNRMGILICENCGRSIFDDMFNHTRMMSHTATLTVTPQQDANPTPATGSATLDIRGSDTPLHLHTEGRLVLGRINNRNPRRPDVDLTAYHAFEKGVSCHHAIMYQENDYLLLADLGSTNGTFVNGQRLTPHEPYVLKTGDEIRLGNLVAKLNFNING